MSIKYKVNNQIINIPTCVGTDGDGTNIASGTEEEFETWSENAKVGEVFVVTDDNNSISMESQGEIYDDTERVIGTWFGKPLYRKTIQTTTLDFTPTVIIDIPHNISNLELIKNIYGVFYTTDSSNQTVYPMPYTSATSESSGDFSVWGNISNIRLRSQSARSNFICIVTLEYTKVGD